MQPFLIQFINILKPKVVIQQGDPWLNAGNIEANFKNKFTKETLIFNFPSMDVLGRAPQRKKDVWEKILKIKYASELKKGHNGN